MIGWYCIATFPYYDNQNNRNAFKRRPMLVIGQADTSDFVTLPISKVSYRENIDIEYDIAIQIADYPRMQLRLFCKCWGVTNQQAFLGIEHYRVRCRSFCSTIGYESGNGQSVEDRNLFVSIL